MPTPQNGQTHSNNSSTVDDGLLRCVWPFCGVAAWRVNNYYFKTNVCELTKTRRKKNLLTPSVPVIWELNTMKKEVFVSYFFAPDIKFDWKVELRVTFMKFNNKKFANICWLIKKRGKFKNLGLLHKRNFEVKIFSKWANLRVRVRLLSISECYILENFV